VPGRILVAAQPGVAWTKNMPAESVNAREAENSRFMPLFSINPPQDFKGVQ